MKASDLIKSITVSDVTPINMKVVTAWRGQTEDQFIKGVKGVKHKLNMSLGISGNPIPVDVDSLNYLCIFGACNRLLTPDGASVLNPDFKIFRYKQPGNITGETVVSLYKFNN
jgi:hypothetical protein